MKWAKIVLFTYRHVQSISMKLHTCVKGINCTSFATSGAHHSEGFTSYESSSYSVALRYIALACEPLLAPRKCALRIIVTKCEAYEIVTEVFFVSIFDLQK